MTNFSPSAEGSLIPFTIQDNNLCDEEKGGWLSIIALSFCLSLHHLFYIPSTDTDFIISSFCTVLNWFVFGIIMCLPISERISWNTFRHVVEAIVTWWLHENLQLLTFNNLLLGKKCLLNLCYSYLGQSW